MITKENPVATNDGVGIQTGKSGLSTDTNSTATTDPEPQRIPISEQGANYIDEISNGLAARSLELWQLPPSLHWFYVRAWVEGRESRNHEIERLNFEADLWYWVAQKPNRKPGDFYRHAESELWQGVAA